MKKISIIFILLFSITKTYSYDFEINSINWRIDDRNKIKIDQYINKKITTNKLRDKLKNALLKLNYNKLNSQKKAIYQYILYRLNPVISTSNLNKTNSWTTAFINNTIIADKSSSVTWNTLYFYEKFNFNEVNKSLIIEGDIYPNTERTNDYKKLDGSYVEYIEKIKSKTKDYVETNDKFEYWEYGNLYKAKIKEYYIIEFNKPSSIYTSLPNLWQEILIKKWNSFILSKWWYNTEKKISISEISKTSFISTKNQDIVFFVEEDWNLNSIDLYSYKYYPLTNNENWIYLSQYPKINNLSKTILYKSNVWYELIYEYNKKSLFDINILYWVTNQKEFINAIWKDIYNYNKTDIEEIIKEIKQKSIDITSNLSNENDKIKEIYKFITSQIKYDVYSQTFIEWKVNEETFLKNVDKDVFTWIWAFKNKIAVCDWYSKLFLYMLSFSWIKNISIESWEANINWKMISHAWIRIGDKLYDPTWDINSLWNETYFKWFGLSQAEMYKTHFIKK